MLFPEEMADMGGKFQAELLFVQAVEHLQDAGFRVGIHKQADGKRRDLQRVLDGECGQYQVRFRLPDFLLLKIMEVFHNLHPVAEHVQHLLYAHLRKHLVVWENHHHTVFVGLVQPFAGRSQMQRNKTALHLGHRHFQHFLKISHHVNAHLKNQRVLLFNLLQENIFQHNFILCAFYQAAEMHLKPCHQVLVFAEINPEHLVEAV